jgi:hypothetical protein
MQYTTHGLDAITYLWVGCNHLPMGWVQSPTYGLGATCNLWIPRNHGWERTHMCVKSSNKYNQISQGCKQPSVSPLHGSYRLMLAPTSGSIVTLFTLARLRLLLRQQKPILYGSILYFPGCIIFTDSSHWRTRKHQICKMWKKRLSCGQVAKIGTDAAFWSGQSVLRPAPPQVAESSTTS